jgi:hypothetical protein
MRPLNRNEFDGRRLLRLDIWWWCDPLHAGGETSIPIPRSSSTVSLLRDLAGLRLAVSLRQLFDSVQTLEERHAGVGNGGIILVGNPSIVAENVALFRLNQSQQTIDR